MATLTRVIDCGNSEEWQEILARFQLDDVYFSPEYCRLNEMIIEGKCEAFLYEKGEILVFYPYLKRKIRETGYFDITSPYGYGGFIANRKDVDISGFYREFSGYCQEEGIVSEFIRFHPFYDNHLLLGGNNVEIQSRQSVAIVDFSKRSFFPEKYITKDIGKKLNKSINHGVTVVEDPELIYLGMFVRLYHENMRAKMASSFYYFEEKYFYEFFKKMKNKTKLIVAIVNGKMVGGMIVLFSSVNGYNYLSCYDIEYKKCCVNDAIQYYSINNCLENGIKKYLLGGGLVEEDSLFRFKAKFSNDIVQFFIGKKIHNSKIYNEFIFETTSKPNLIEGLSEKSWFPLYRCR